MKAQEYAEQYKAEGATNDALARVVRAMMQEVADIGKQRQVSTNEGFISILNEMEQRWHAFTRIVGDPAIRKDGFEKMVREHTPDVHFWWMKSKVKFRPTKL